MQNKNVKQNNKVIVDVFKEDTYMYEDYTEVINAIKGICDCFITPDDDEDIADEVNKIVRKAFLYRIISWMTECRENIAGMKKSRILEVCGYYVEKEVRWQHFVQDCKNGIFNIEELKKAAGRLGKQSRLFDALVSGELDKENCSLYAEGCSFEDVILAVDKLPFEENCPDECYDDDMLVQYLILNEMHRRQGDEYVEADEFIPKFYEYCETQDDSEVRTMISVIMNSGAIKKAMVSLFNNPEWKKKSILSDIFDLYLDRYGFLAALKQDENFSVREAASEPSLLEKTEKLFGYACDEDDPKNQNASRIYEGISTYLKNQPMEFYRGITYPMSEQALIELLYNVYDKAEFKLIDC